MRQTPYLTPMSIKKNLFLSDPVLLLLFMKNLLFYKSDLAHHGCCLKGLKLSDSTLLVTDNLFTSPHDMINSTDFPPSSSTLFWALLLLSVGFSSPHPDPFKPWSPPFPSPPPPLMQLQVLIQATTFYSPSIQFWIPFNLQSFSPSTIFTIYSLQHPQQLHFQLPTL